MKKFLAGVASLFAYDNNDNLLFSSKTMLDSSIDIGTSSQEVRGGQGAPIQFVYFHSGTFKLTATETQWNLGFISVNTGASVATGANVWTEESVVLTSGSGSVVGIPIATSTGNIYGWVTDTAGVTTRVTFSTKAFTKGSSNETVTVRYYQANSAATQVTISGNIVPSVVRLVLDAQLFSSSGGSANASSKIGNVLVEVANAQLSGAQKIDLKSTGVSDTPLALTALSDVNGNYATITEVITSAHWYDNVSILAYANDAIAISSGSTTLQLYAIPATGSAFQPPVADISFTSSATGICTVGLHTGIVTKVAAGSSIVTATITAKNTVTANADITVS